MNSYELVEISQKNFDFILENSCPDAPWMSLPGEAMNFLQEGVSAGVDWRIHNDVLVAYTKPKSKSEKQRQERARRDMEWAANLNLYPSGILLFGEVELGRWREGELYEHLHVAGKDHLMEDLMNVFWQDIPPLAWRKLGEILVRREMENHKDFMGQRSVAQDYLDFGRAYRVLSSVGKMQAQKRMDWNEIANPVETGVKKKANP